ncbi:phospho-sugar mutase [Rubinisphaera sp.]|uniref:phospho-sugar mutase n=1 Tax=Rubinisphaera sp. TaxID=2024857 RepID=UPI000C0C6957|nr:phospho-sugar mutase [Rubinisphaera sp.]MBV07984.1 phosphomannomutase [Rubinisphaera sp.]HCS50539.1 phospho-sugar mutase [Planctomycetaceae bacterium]|tara:strand:- start:4079 stop:5908 length:1830 start_codon:yes stop_codon:yes gene_type:complete
MNSPSVSKCKTIVKNAAAAKLLTDGAAKNIKRWLSEPQYSEYVEPIRELIEAEQFGKLDALFWEVIAFGTGGRRGPMADFGSATINPRTIAESAHGLATYLKLAGINGSNQAVVTCDSRNRSMEFARLTACVLAAHGLKVYFFPEPRSTPELSFSVRHLNCDIGVMISASHNPPEDNGFKAYWNTGGQVLPPHDKGIVDCVYDAGEIPTIDFEVGVQSGSIEILDQQIDDAYHAAVLEMSLSSERELTAIYTPLHGVGETACFQILKKAGFDGVQILEAQRAPNGDFPNVDQHMPNPERTEVFKESIEKAKQVDASLILASDPDADRLGVCVRNQSGQFVHLTGNQIGSLIVDYILRKRSETGTLSPEHFVVETLVTTPLIGAISQAHNVKCVDDLLVGFKYIGEAMDAGGPEKFVFGAEESLGFLAGTYARDKDAGIASLYICEAAAELQTQGKSLLDRLDELYKEHGYFLEGQKSQVCTGSSGKAQINALMHAFRVSPPTVLGGIPLNSVRDFERHQIRGLPDNLEISDLPAPSGNLLFFEAATETKSVRIAVRPSGTEPKIKFYLFVSSKVGERFLDNVKEETKSVYQAVQADLMKWIEVQLATKS